MSLLIRNGVLHTQSALGVIRGDVLTDGGRIAALGEHLPVDDREVEHVIDARGLHVCPGLIDAHVHLIRAAERMETDVRATSVAALSAGITTCALWQESGDPCLIRHGTEAALAPGVRCVNADGMRDDPLRRVMEACRRKGERVGCEVFSPAGLRRLLRLGQETGCGLLLAHLTGCGAMAAEIAASGCGVILGACSIRSDKGPALQAGELLAMGVQVALTADYPATRLHHLPMTAGLCHRAGLDAERALGMITIGAAGLLGLDQECGSIETGKRADLTLFDGDPLRMATARVMTLLSGELL